ncbi:hypothetical protein KJ762_08035 [bacterium]|nr:hypothetical protein [bacterium]MBU1064371.1 hypothetical protein [bacterium]MBU1634442.1 hypothetical protein [bacterium]MBU1874600.1 hypothetical protein [bacterium]
MQIEVIILILEAITVYFLVLWVHSLRSRFGLAHFYALIGGITAVMSWITDAGVKVEIAGITFMVGSTVFYTALLLGVFIIYVFDGPRATRIAISTIAGVSILVPLIAMVLHLQMKISNYPSLGFIPIPSFRINTASVITTVADMIFLAVAWEFFGKKRLGIQLWLRAFLTLLGVMWLDVILFASGAFLGTPEYLNIMQGTLISRLFISVFAFPFLFLYLNWQNKKTGMTFENRPVLSILREVAEIRAELTLAQQEIEYRKKIEREKEILIRNLEKSISEIKTLRGLLPICASCKKIRDDAGFWQQIEKYIQDNSEAVFTHGICPDCGEKLYPDIWRKKNEQKP